MAPAIHSLVHPTPSWQSVHFHFDATTIYGAEADKIVVRLVDPLVRTLREQSCVDGFFFIRYMELGAHIRLRLRGRGDSIVTEGALEYLLRTANEAGDGPPVRGVWAAYEPEIVRYGGRHALLIAERVFEASSVAAIALIDRGTLSQNSRLGRAILAMLAILSVFLKPSDGAGFAARYCDNYLPSVASWQRRATNELIETFRRGMAPQEAYLHAAVGESWCRLQSGESTSIPIDAYVATLREAREELYRRYEAGQIVLAGSPASSWDHCVNLLLPSFVHMMNNRLGISIEQETYLAFIIRAGLEAIEAERVVPTGTGDLGALIPPVADRRDAVA